MQGIIYGIKNNLINKIVYIGQTINFIQRKSAHKSSAFNINSPQYEYPLYRAIRKYGYNNFEFIVLAQCDASELDQQECAFIAEYNTYEQGYNLTTGGSNFIGEYTTLYDKEIIAQIVDDIVNSSISFQDIASKFNVSAGLVSALNMGKHSQTQDMPTPLRMNHYKMNDNTIQDIYDLIQYSSLQLQEIAKRYFVSINYISEINTGRKYFNPNFNYPLRKYEISFNEDEYKQIFNLLANTKTSMVNIGKQFGVSEKIISEINLGNKNFQPSLQYPIRKSRLTKEEVKQIQQELQHTTLTIVELAKKYSKSKSTIYNINNGTSFRNKDVTYPIRTF